MKKKKHGQKAKALELLVLLFYNVVGTLIYAVGISCFTAPHNIAPGGASGIAILVHYVTGFPMGAFVFLFNIPLLIWIWIKRYFERKFVIRAMLTTGMLSIMTDLIVVHFPKYTGNTLLAAMFGGALLGVGLAFVHLGQSSTGGISLLGVIIKKINPRFQVGSLISLLNILVVAASGLIYRNIDNLLYAVLAVYLSGLFMDRLLNSASSKGLLIVIAECTDRVRGVFLEEGRPITVLKGEGGYTSETQRVILCAADKGDCEKLQEKIRQTDPKALLITTEASKVEGKGFRHLM